MAKIKKPELKWYQKVARVTLLPVVEWWEEIGNDRRKIWIDHKANAQYHIETFASILTEEFTYCVRGAGEAYPLEAMDILEPYNSETFPNYKIGYIVQELATTRRAWEEVAKMKFNLFTADSDIRKFQIISLHFVEEKEQRNNA